MLKCLQADPTVMRKISPKEGLRILRMQTTHQKLLFLPRLKRLTFRRRVPV